MEADRVEPQVPEQQREALGAVAGGAEYHETVAPQLVQDEHRVAVLQSDKKTKVRNRPKVAKSRPKVDQK